jgi:hypothetical protein
MDNNQKVLLKKLINENDIEDQTDKIRELKHSALIKQDIINFNILKQKNTELYLKDPDQFNKLCIQECTFLFTNYTDIYHKVIKNTIDLNMFGYFLQILEQIEQGTLDQHTASFKIGTLLKEIYIDSAVREGDLLDEQNAQHDKNKGSNLSWKQYKTQNNL